MKRIADANLALNLLAETVRLAVRRQRALDRPTCFIFSEGPRMETVVARRWDGSAFEEEKAVVGQDGRLVMTRDEGVKGHTRADEIADAREEYEAEKRRLSRVG